MPKIGLHLQEVHVSNMHLLVKYLVAGLARLLRSVHRGICITKEVLRRPGARGSRHDDANRCAREDLVIVDLEGLGDTCLYALRDGRDLLLITGAVQKNCEFVPAEASDHVRRTNA